MKKTLPTVVGTGTLPTVDELLDSIDLTFPDYTPSKEALHFWNTMQLIKGPQFFSLGIPVLHYYFIDLAFNKVDRNSLPYTDDIKSRVKMKKNKLAILCSRGLSKSTTFSSFLVIYMAMFGILPGLVRPNVGNKVRFVIGVGDSQEGGAKLMCNTIRDMIDESELLSSYFEDIRTTDAEIELVRKGTGSKASRSFMFRTRGAQSGIRGQRYRGDRIDVIIGDDLVKNESDSRSKVIMESIRSTIYSDATHALRGEGGMEILIGTPFNKSDVVYSAVEGGWTPLVVPICNDMHKDMKEEDFVGAWPEMHTFDRITSRYEDMADAEETRAFNQELMLRISSAEDKLVKADQIQWYSRTALKKNLHMFNIYVTTDLTASNSLKGDFSVVMGWAVNSVGDFFLLDLSVKKMTIDDQYKPIFQMNRDWGAKYGRNVTVGIEIDGQQQLNLHTLKKQMIEYNSFFTFGRQLGSPAGREGISRRQATGAKHEQFMRVHPLFQQHKIYFPEELKETPDMKELLNELQYITYTGIGSKNDDALDGISMLASMDIMLPAAEDTNTYTTIDADGLIWESIWGDEDGDEYVETNSTVF